SDLRRLRGPLHRWLASLPATTPFVSKRSSRTSPLPCPAALEPAHQGTQIVHRHWEKTSVFNQWSEEMPGFGNETQERLAKALKDEALRLGFDACGISKAEPLDEEARQLEAWLNAGMHASMSWMERHFDKRIDPRQLVPGAKSVISVLHNYYQPVSHPDDPTIGKISRYAWGDDYHDVLKEKLFELYAWLETEVGSVSGRDFRE